MATRPEPANSGYPDGASAAMRRPLLPAIRWGAVLAGVAVGVSVQLALTLLGIASGQSRASVAQDQPIGAAALLWASISMLIAAFIGGYVAARMSGLKRKADGVMHGVVAWAVTTLLFASLASPAAGSMVSGLFNTVNPLGAMAGPAAMQSSGGDLGAMLRRQIGGNVNDVSMKALLQAIRGGRRDEAVQLMVNAIGLDEARAASLVDQALVLIGSPQNLTPQGRAAADRTAGATGAAGIAAWAVFLGVALSLVLGIVGGAFGSIGSRRTTWSENAVIDEADQRRRALTRTPA